MDSEKPDDEVNDVDELGRFALIKFPQKKTSVFHVGEVLEIHDDEIKVDSYRYANGRFTKPEQSDRQFVAEDQMELVFYLLLYLMAALRSIAFAMKLKTYSLR